MNAPREPKLRAEITKRIIDFYDNPKEFVKKFEQEQCDLKQKIINARKILKQVQIQPLVFEIVSKIINELGISSQRADITFVRCARTHAAFSGRKIITEEDLNLAMDLVFEHRLQSLHYELTPKEIEAKIATVFGKIREAYENEDIYKPNKETEGPLKHSDKTQEEFKRQPIDKDKVDVPETKEQKLPPPQFPDEKRRKTSPAGGWKVKQIPMNDEDLNKMYEEEFDLFPFIYKMERKVVSILDQFRSDRKISDFGGRGIGRRIKIASTQKGRYSSYRIPINSQPKSIALDATIRNYLKNTIYNQTDVSFPLHFNKYDLMDKIFEYRAPLVLFFVLDSSASMFYVIKQMTDVILSLQKEGYRKRDKIALIVFRGKEAVVLQKPTVNFKVAISKLKNLEGKSYTPMASALKKCIELVKTERIKNRNIIPALFICSDCGANISVKNPELIAQVESDYSLIVEELDDLMKKLMHQKIHTVVLEPKKSFATQALGVHTPSAEQIKEDFKKFGRAEIYQFDKYNPEGLILELKKIV